MAGRNLTVKIIGDSRSLERAFGRSSRSARTFNATIAGTSRSLARGLGFTAAVSGIAGVGVALRSTVGAAIDFESSFAGVRKTVDATEPQFAKLAAGFRTLSREIPVSVGELNRIGEAAGQLGIQRDAILGFTRTVADLGATTNIASEDAANALARIANITQLPQDQFDQLGSTIVDLGNKLAATESEIVEMSLRLAGAGNQIGLTEAQILSFAGALSSVGINAEAGGSAFSRVFATLANDVASGGKKLQLFAKVSGQSAAEFRQQFGQDAAGAVVSFVEGLGRIEESGGNVFAVLKDLGLGEVRVRDALLRTAGAADLVRRSLEIGDRAWQENNALQSEAAKRYDTTASRLLVFRNRVQDLQVTLGTALLPTLEGIIGPLSEWLNKTENQERVQRDFRATLEAVTATMRTLRDVFGPVVRGVGGLENAIKLLVAAMVIGKVARFATAIRLLNTRLLTLTRFGQIGIVIGVTLVGKEILDRVSKFADENGGTRRTGRVATKGGVFEAKDLNKQLDARRVEAWRRQIHLAGRSTKEMAEHFELATRGARTLNDELGRPTPRPFTAETAANQTRGLTVEQRNTFFDSRIARQVDRVQDIRLLRDQIARLREIAATISARITVTKDITRRLNLEDELLAVQRQIRQRQTQVAQNIADAVREAAATARKVVERERERLAAAREQARDLAGFAVDLARTTVSLTDDLRALRNQESVLRAQLATERGNLSLRRDLLSVQQQIAETIQSQNNARQFRSLGLGPTGGEIIPGVKALRKSVGSISDAVKGSFLDTGKTRSVLANIRKVLAGGLGKVSAEVRSKVKELLDGIDQQLKDHAGRNLTRGKAVDTSKILAGLGLTPDQIRELRGRVSQISSSGRVPNRGTGAFGIGFKQQPVVVHTAVNLDGKTVATNTTRHQQQRARQTVSQRGGRNAGVGLGLA